MRGSAFIIPRHETPWQSSSCWRFLTHICSTGSRLRCSGHTHQRKSYLVCAASSARCAQGMGFPLLSLLMQLALFVLLGLIAHAEAASNDSDISLVHRGEAFWLCRTGTKGVSCGSRREPVLNDSKVYCGSGFCCPDTEDVVPQTCKEEPCEKQFPRTPGACSEFIAS